MKQLIRSRIIGKCSVLSETSRRLRPPTKLLAVGAMFVAWLGGEVQQSPAADYVIGSVRVQCLSHSLVRLEVIGANGFENRGTFHVVNRDWPGTTSSSNLVAGEVRIGTANYVVHVPAGTTSLAGIYLTTPAGLAIFQANTNLSNSGWLPGPSENPMAWSFADAPRLVPPAWGLTPAPVGVPNAATSGWDLSNDAPDLYVFVPNGSYAQLRRDFLKLTGPTEMIPLYAFGMWDSRYYDYSETTALREIDENRSRQIPLDVLVVDTGWRINASTGYEPNSNLFPDLPGFFSKAHAKNARVVFNDHPEPVGISALDPREVNYRYTNVAQITGIGLDAWWYDRNWSASIFSPAPNLRKEVWGMKIYNDTAARTNTTLRPLIMANADGIDNGIRNRPPNVAAHRYSIQWTGDTYAGLDYLNFGIQNAVHAGIHWTYPYLSEDLGGHNGNTAPGDYLRWIEYGALSPIYRPHCTLNLRRMPWSFGSQAEWVARRFLNLRYRLLPEFYAAAHQNYETGEPILRRLDLDYPQYPEASQNNQYLLTHSLLVAPIASGGLSVVPTAWLTTSNAQPGLQAAYFNNEELSGSPALSRVDANIDFNWGAGSPGGTIGNDHFSVRWTGNLTVPAAIGDIILAATSDDGIRVWVDNVLCIGNWGANDSATTESTVSLKAGQAHRLRVEFLEGSGNAIMSLKWRAAQTERTVWLPPGNWINAWSGSVVKGPTTDVCTAPLDQIPLYIRSGSIFALAPEMQFTGQLPWAPVTLDIYPSTTETDQTSLYEDDTLTTGYKQGQFRTTAVKTWANEAAKTVSVSIDAAVGTFPGALAQRSWLLRFRRPVNWTADLSPTQVAVNGAPAGPVLHRIKNATAMPLGDEAGAPDADVFEVVVPASSVASSNFIVAAFSSTPSGWTSRDIGNVGAEGNAVGGLSVISNSVCVLRGSGAGIGGTSDGFHFMSQPCVGNVQLTARLLSQQSLNTNAEAGIMIAESLQRSARCALMAFKPGNFGVFQHRSATGAAAQTVNAGGLITPRWLRLVRSGNNFFGYTSADGSSWNLFGTATISGFNSNAYVGLLVTASTTAGANPDGTNSAGTVITGNTAGMEGGTYPADDTNHNVAEFRDLALNTPVKISSIPNQTTLAGAAPAAIPFVVTTTGGSTLTVTAQSSDASILPIGNIMIFGDGANRFLALTPTMLGGKVTVILTASDGSTTASTEFTLTVLAAPASRELLSESFSGYSVGNIIGQSYRGTGFPSGAWIGRNVTFTGGANDAAQFSATGLPFPALATSGGKIIIKGDGSNLQGLPDLSTGGLFASTGLYDAASGTVGGGNVSGTLYVRFLMRALATDHDSEYGGLHLSRGDDMTGVLIGNSWVALAYSLFYPPTNTSADLKNNNGMGNYRLVDNGTHLLVAKITYTPGGDDKITAWLDPDPTKPEPGQDSATTYIGSMTGDFSFDRFLLRGGNNKQFEFDEIKFGTTWNSVLPASNAVSVSPPAITSVPFLVGNAFGFYFQGAPGLAYSVLTSTNLVAANWQKIADGTFAFDPVLFSAAITASRSQEYYRISIP